MKHMKKFMALFAALALVLAMAVPAFAADPATYTITAPAVGAGEVGHTYQVYQIFTGDLSEGALSNVKWGKNGVEAVGTAVDSAVLDALKNVSATASDTTKLAVIEQYADLTGVAFGTVDSGNTLDNVPAGYYLIKDKDGTLAGVNDAYTTYIVTVVNDVTIHAKSAKPTVDKQVLDEAADAEAGNSNGWGESADHAINEEFQFRLIATIPADVNFDAYKEYAVKFNDTMSKGVVFDHIDSVEINGVSVPAALYTTTATSGMTASASETSKSWSLEISDIKSIPGFKYNSTTKTEIVVTYTAHLNELAKVNTANGDTTNKNTVDLEYSNNPNSSGMGKTEEDHVWVFTYGVDNTKYDATDSEHKIPLAGAEFTLYTDADCTKEFGLIYDDSMGAYRPVKANETATSMVSAADGKFNIRGLDAGTYYLKETKTPTGYNTCDVITVKIDAAHEEDATGTSANVTFTQDTSLSFDVDNKRGTTLPSTGGIGTTIFYVVGGALMVGAAVLLVTKKRMENK